MNKTTVCALYVLATGLLACRGDAPQPAASQPGPLAAAQPAARPTASSAQPVAPLPQPLGQALESYRKIIVLLEDVRRLDLPDQRRADAAGRLLYQQKHQQLSALIRDFTDDVRAQPARLDRVIAFLDALEGHPDLRDADKLAFRDVVDEVSDAMDGARLPASARPLRTRLQEDASALGEIQTLYSKELEKIFGRFETRGLQVRREAWEAYVEFLRTKYTARSILEQHAADVQQVSELRVESDLEMSGTRLPAKSLVLTFDDGPHARRTDQVLAILKRFEVKAVFFQVGQNVSAGAPRPKPTRASAAGKRVIEAGHALGNHSYSHALLPKLSDAEIAEQIERTNSALDTLASGGVTLFRPPYGARDQKVLAAVRARQMKSVLWNVDSKDWADPIPLSIANRVVRAVDGEKRGILLFHDIQQQTVEALPAILETLQARGYRFLSWNGSTFVDEQPKAQAAAPPAAAPALYRESFAVIVGIDAYQHWPKLSYAANDARAMRELIVGRYGFKPENVTLLLNEQATREGILEILGDRLADQTRVKREDRVFVFFAGHGATRTLPNGRSLGYIIPVDADVSNYQSQAISMTNFQDISDAVPAKHVLFVTDACYGGLALTRGGSQTYLQQITRRVARQMLTAGGADEQVADNGPNGHSIFTWTLMQGLEGRGDLNADGFITASELAAYTGPIVSSLSRQTPAFGALAGSEGGEFVFQLSHETEFLSQESDQLEEEGIRLNAELDKLRAAIAVKRARNEQLRAEVLSARAEAAGVPPATSASENDRGTVLFREKRYPEALAAFQEAARLAPSAALPANNVGFTFYRMGNYPQAAEWLERTVKLDPGRAIAHANLGDAYARMSEPAKARAAYERYLHLQPNGSYSNTVRTRLQDLTSR